MKSVSPSFQHNVFKIQIKPEQEITVRSDFDSGNMGKVEFVPSNTLVMTPANDCAGTQFEGHSKSWFYFKISGVVPQTSLKFVIKRIHMLASQSKFTDYYRPVYCCRGQPWKRVETASVITREDDTEIQFEHKFQKSSEVAFAFSFPYSYQQLQRQIRGLQMDNRNRKDLYFNSQIMIKSPQSRNIHLITVSSHQGKESTRESRIDDNLFVGATRAYKFKPTKKVILITARVHPGETPGSHVMNGILDFLLSKDARAMLLRKNFVFMLVPMLNPDGVFHGHYRMDVFNQNLNRFYISPIPEMQPGPFGVKTLAEHLEAQKRLCFFMDLHAHAGRCGNFFYGNALQQLNEQIQTQLFAKVMSLNCVNFQFESCNFSKKQMTSKDRNEELTKEGSSRVAMYRISKLVYSYTLECGYHYSFGLNDLKLPLKYHRKMDGYGITYDELENIRSPTYQSGNAYYTIPMYQNIGKAILVSILDVFDSNPFSRIPNTQYKDLKGVRKEVEEMLTRTVDRFKRPLGFKRNRLTAPQIPEGTRKVLFQANRTRAKIFPKSAVKIQIKIETRKTIRIRGISLPKGLKLRHK